MIKILLNELLVCFLKKEFNADSEVIKLNKDNSIGRFIIAHVKYSQTKKENQIGNLTFEIPYDNLKFNQRHYAYFSPLDYKNVIDYIQAMFDLKIKRFFTNGEKLGYQRQQIVYALIKYYGFPMTSATFEMLKKRDFRDRRHILRVIADNIENC
jgi:hypothetical protein